MNLFLLEGPFTLVELISLLSFFFLLHSFDQLGLFVGVRSSWRSHWLAHQPITHQSLSQPTPISLHELRSPPREAHQFIHFIHKLKRSLGRPHSKEQPTFFILPIRKRRMKRKFGLSLRGRLARSFL